MTPWAYLFLGMAIQAGATGVLTATGLMNPTHVQQMGAAVVCGLISMFL